MPKLKFNDLKYIVMEGGGARGAAYLGAIRAMETLMAERTDVQKYNTNGRKAGLLDYSKTFDNTLAIKGIAGSSAGAIITFALALGFNSDEIDEILKYPFDEFLKDVDVGKYRMIDEDGKLAIGQDKRKNKTVGDKELTKDAEFKFQFDSDNTPIGNNLAKQGKRKLITGTVFKVVADGTVSNIQQITNLVGRIFKIDSPEDAPSFWRGLFRWAVRPNNNFIVRVGLARALRFILFGVLIPTRIIKVPIKMDDDTLLAAVLDRGMFSGFAVREFFMDLVILAATKDTHFQRGFLKFIRDKDHIDQIEVDKIKAELLRIKGFKIGKRSESKLNTFPYFKKYSSYLENLTFKQFNKITGLDFAVCVSNFTTGFPLYFSHEWTPDFRVMEAVAASMTIPPAIKPLYNASDVVQKQPNEVSKVPFLKSDGSFELSDFYLYEYAVKKILAEKIKEVENTSISINNTIDLSAFLPTLQILVIGKTDKTGEFKEVSDADKKKTYSVSVGNKVIIVDYNTLRFFYNAAYKGLLIDGGYRNNIPFDFFRLRNDNIDTVFAIKLDEHFPPDIMENVYNAIKDKLNKVETSEIIDDIDLKELDTPEIESGAISELLNNSKTQTYKTTKADIILQTELIFSKYLNLWAERGKDDEEKAERRKIVRDGFKNRKGEKAIRRLVRSTLKHYRKKHLTSPWAVPKSILAAAIEGYEYGSEKGQIKDISDHNHILPLYDYGISTYDFKLDKVMPQVLLAQAQAEQATLDFFNTP